MPNALGLTLYLTGIISIIISVYILNLIISKYLKNNQLKKYFYLFIFLTVIFMAFRVYMFFYIQYLADLNLPEDILSEKLLFARIFSHIPLAIAFTLLLFICYSCLAEIKYKLDKFYIPK